MYMRTSDPSIYAAGDSVEVANLVTDRVAVYNLYELKRPLKGVVPVYITVIGDKALGSAGIRESIALKEGFKTLSAKLGLPDKHPLKMPGTGKMFVKVIVEKNTGRLLSVESYGATRAVYALVTLASNLIYQKAMLEDLLFVHQASHPHSNPQPPAHPLVNAVLKLYSMLCNQ